MKPILKRSLIEDGRYKLQDYREGEMLPLVSDVMFHTMLNNESRKQYVSYLLSLILEKNYEEIYNSIEFSKEQLDKENYHESKKTVDLVCKIEGEIFNIEMNNNMSIPSLERNISYMNKLYSGSMKIGKKEYQYNKVIQINLNNFNFKENKNEIDEFYIMNHNREILTDKIRIIYIYLPLIRKKLYNKEKLTSLEKLLLSFNEKDSDELKKVIKGEKFMEEYRRDAYDASQDSEILGLYNKEEEDKMLEAMRINYAKEEGVEQGIKQGIEKGIEQGSKQAKIEMAKNLINENVPLETISKWTGLDIKTIENLK